MICQRVQGVQFLLCYVDENGTGYRVSTGCYVIGPGGACAFYQLLAWARVYLKAPEESYKPIPFICLADIHQKPTVC